MNESMLLSKFHFFYQIPQFVRWFYPYATFRCQQDKKIIYLTFDDGCVPEVTPHVLDILDRYGIKATFFIVGENAQKYPELLQEEICRGHRIGNHTYNHLKGLKTSTETYLRNVEQAQQLLHTDLFRPPYGKMKAKQKLYLCKHYEIILWDLITHDYDKRISPEQIMSAIRKYSRNGSIILFHDSIKAAPNMLKVLPQAIEYWLSEGYTFDTL